MDRRSFPTTTDTSKLAGAVDPAAALKDLDSRNNPHSTIRVTTRFSGGALRQHKMNSNSSEPSTCPRLRAQAATFALILDQSRLNSQLIGTALVLDMDLKIQTSRRAQGCCQRGSRPDLSNGCRESDLGSAAHSRRTAQAGFRGLGKECLAMDAASPERCRSRQAMADIPQKPSRGHCGDRLFHRPNAHVWCSVLLFRHRPRPAQDPALQCDEKSPCALGCTAIARSMGLPTSAPILAIRPRRKVWRRGGFGCEGDGKRANSHGLWLSVAERCC